MKTHDDIVRVFGGTTAISQFIDSVLRTNNKSKFDRLLDFSYNNNIIISSDYAGEDPPSSHFVYSALFSTFKPTLDWMDQVQVRFKELGYSGEPQYKDIPPNAQQGKFIDFMNISGKYFKGFLLSLAVPKDISCCFDQSTNDLYNVIKAVSGLPKIDISEKNAEKALRIASIISIGLYLTAHKSSGFHWLSDRDSITKTTATHNVFENTILLLRNLLNNLFAGENRLTGNVGYSQPWVDDKRNFCYNLIALNDLLSGSIANLLSGKALLPKAKAILERAQRLKHYIYVLKRTNVGFSACRKVVKVK